MDNQPPSTGISRAGMLNAFGQQEEGVSKWAARREAKRQMYLNSTEKQTVVVIKKKKK